MRVARCLQRHELASVREGVEDKELELDSVGRLGVDVGAISVDRRDLLLGYVQRQRLNLISTEATEEGHREPVDTNVRGAIEERSTRRLARLGHLVRDLRVFDHLWPPTLEGEHAHLLMRLRLGDRLVAKEWR